MSFRALRSDQTRQLIDTAQVFQAYLDARHEHGRRFMGSTVWKTVSGRNYLYRKRDGVWRSLGPRSTETEATERAFREGRAASKDRLQGLAQRLDEMAPVNRALLLGRVPFPASRVLRGLDEAGLIGGPLTLVGTNALFAYERLAGVQVESGQLATGDIDLLYDARARLDLAGPEVAAGGVLGLLRKVDRSYALTGPGSFRAVNRDGYLVDLIRPLPKDALRRGGRSRVGSDAEDLSAVEIEGLGWLVNAPKIHTVSIDERGYPLRLVVPDPRVFALHKLWVSRRSDREAAQRRRDEAQAILVADLLRTSLRHLPFDDTALSAVPRALRALAGELAPPEVEPRTEPGW